MEDQVDEVQRDADELSQEPNISHEEYAAAVSEMDQVPEEEQQPQEEQEPEKKRKKKTHVSAEEYDRITQLLSLRLKTLEKSDDNFQGCLWKELLAWYFKEVVHSIQ